ncbi:MAG: CHASE2 domain-containing protein [Phycisphaeraceae bacterium]|nr:CHASE2 domain-containing protein [Phycisphaeraceae bacterium]
MTTSERNLLLRTTVLGILLTLGVVVAVRAGWLNALENWIYDRRVATCQFFTPPPTDKLIHLDIDDLTLEAMGTWPWPRARLAYVVDELRLAGAKAVGLDIVFPEPQAADYEPRQGTTEPAENGGVKGVFDTIANDDIFADSVRRMQPTLVPLSFDLQVNPSPRAAAMLAESSADLELTYDEVDRKLAQIHGQERGNVQEDQDRYIQMRRLAMFNRVLDLLSRKPASIEELRALLLPRTDPQLTGSPQIRLLRGEYDRVQSLLSLRRFSRSVPDGLPLFLPGNLAVAPTVVLARAASMTGFVYYQADDDGVVRSIPLWAEHRGFLFPQFGLALACAQLNVSPADIRFDQDRITIPVKGRADIVIPMRRRHFNAIDKDVGFILDIPWFGTPDWQTMYDPNHRDYRQHWPLLQVWQAHELSERIITNNRSADIALESLLTTLGADAEPQLLKLRGLQGRYDDPDSRLPIMEWARQYLETNGYFQIYEGVKYEELVRQEREARKALEDAEAAARDPLRKTPEIERTVEDLRNKHEARNDEIKFFSALQLIKRLPGEVRALKDQLTQERTRLRNQVHGRSVLVGWTATGAAADFVPTSLHAKCPGPVVHGVIFNAIMTGEVWWRASGWTTLAITLVLGLAVTAAVARLSPGLATLASFLLGVGYLFVNAIVLFDYGNLLVNASGPLVAVATVWSGTTLYRFAASIAERRRMKRIFQNYVDPALVDHALENPDAVRPQVREVTVAFTDLAGFTTLSEQLQAKTVEILNEYFTLMVPVMAEQKEPIIKFLGDGIMVFYGAPRSREDHAQAAVTTVLKMQQALPGFNQTLVERGLPTLKMRAGVSTGSMIVGAAGTKDRIDYTVLGDNVNLGSRLEGANKATGTLTLISQRTAELVGEEFLLRPIGRLVVVGKTEGVMTYEPLAYRNEATEQQRTLVTKTRAMVDAFQRSRFEECLAAISELDDFTGPSPLSELYRSLCEKYLKEPPPDGFVGQVVLTEK